MLLQPAHQAAVPAPPRHGLLHAVLQPTLTLNPTLTLTLTVTVTVTLTPVS